MPSMNMADLTMILVVPFQGAHAEVSLSDKKAECSCRSAPTSHRWRTQRFIRPIHRSAAAYEGKRRASGVYFGSQKLESSSVQNLQLGCSAAEKKVDRAS